MFALGGTKWEEQLAFCKVLAQESALLEEPHFKNPPPNFEFDLKLFADHEYKTESAKKLLGPGK